MLSFAGALGAGLAFGIASVLQQMGARRSPLRPLGVRLLADLARQPLFLAGFALDAAGFVLTLVAVQQLPLFVVQAAVSSSVAVTAVTATRFLGDRLGRWEWWMVGATALGLTLLAVSASSEDPRPGTGGATIALLSGLPALTLVGLAASRSRISSGLVAAGLGALAGAGFAAFSISGRFLEPWDSALELVTQPLAWGAALYAMVGLALYGAALQRGAVTSVMAACVGIEALLPALVGLALADRSRPGLGGVAVAGFALTLCAALALAAWTSSSDTSRPLPVAES
jgi:hypothetical protein